MDLFRYFGLSLPKLEVCSLQPCGHLLGKSWPLRSSISCVFVTFLFGVVLDCIDS